MSIRTTALIVAVSVAVQSRGIASAGTVQLRMADGPPIEVGGVSFQEGWVVSGTDKQGTVQISAANLIAIDFEAVRKPPSNRHPAVLIADHQMLHGEISRADENAVVVKNALAGLVSVPLQVVEGFLLTSGLGSRAKDLAVSRIRGLERSADAILLANDDVLTGTIEQFGPNEWRISTSGESRTVRGDLVRGVALDPSLLDYKAPTTISARVRLSDGSVIVAKSLVSTPKGLQIETTIGPTIVLETDAVAQISFRGGNFVYLSDQNPLRIESRGFLDDNPHPRWDRCILGTPLSLEGNGCEKGIGTRGFTRIDYSAEGYTRFLARIGVDDAAGESASVVFRVLLDERVAMESEEMTRFSGVKDVAVDLKNAKVVSLVVDFGSRGDVGDAADWCEARLVRP